MLKFAPDRWRWNFTKLSIRGRVSMPTLNLPAGNGRVLITLP